jgi:hypothetical protein
MFGFTSIRSTEFYIIVIIILVFCYLYSVHLDEKLHEKMIQDNSIHYKQQDYHKHVLLFSNSIRNGVIRGAVTGLTLGGLEGIAPASVILSFINVTTNLITSSNS